AVAQALDDQARLVRVLSWTSHIRRITGDPEEAMTVGHQALELATTLGESALQVQASHNLGRIYENRGDFSRAAELMRRTIEAMDRAAGSASPVLQVQSRAWLARILGHIGAFAEGRCYGVEARLRLRPGGRASERVVG